MTGWRHLALGILTAAALPCFGKATRAERGAPFRFDSATAVAMDGTVDELVLRTERATETVYRERITDQLFYLVGLLNHYKSVADLGHAEVRVSKIEEVAGTSLVAVHYSAKFLIGWDKGTTVPAGVPVVLPSRVDDESKTKFFGAFSSTCSEDPNDSDLSAESFYYYFRPESDKCQLFKMHLDPDTAYTTAMAIKPSTQQTEGKAPEYGKIWEDNRLVATMIFGTFKKGATGNGDVGIGAYNTMYTMLRRRFGKPSWQNVSIGGLLGLGVPGMRNPDVEMEWDLGGGRKLNVDILLIDKEALQEENPKLAARYEQRTQISDYVSYNGHSGFGANIRALAHMGSFTKGQYQLYLVNGCDTFAYVDDSLRAAHEAVNPGSKPYEYFDIITNALPAPFAALASENMTVLEAMLGKTATYREILSHFNASQHAIVTGEEDNHWPLPF